MHYFARVLTIAAALFSGSLHAVVVVATIPPLGMISDALLAGGLGSTSLLVDGKQSPHGMSLLPSQRAALEKADLVLWVGSDFETWLVGSITSLRKTAIAMADTEGVQFLPATALQQAKIRQVDHEHVHGAWDMHLWLDPTVMQAYVENVRDALIIQDPQHTAQYQQNAMTLLTEIQRADVEAQALLATAKQSPLLVMHDAWRYYFRHYGLIQGGMVQRTPEQSIGAGSVALLEQSLRQGLFKCVLREPQIEAKSLQWVKAVAPSLQEALTDPLGHPSYVGGYPAWLLDQAKAINSCMKNQ